MQSQYPMLVLVPDPNVSGTPVEQFKSVVEGPVGETVEYQFHLLQAEPEAAQAVRAEGTNAIFGYVLLGTEQGEAAILARDAIVQSHTIEGGTCSLRLTLLPRYVYQPAFVAVPTGGKRVFTVSKPYRFRVSSPARMRWLRRLGLWLFARTGWLWLLRLVQDDK